jgi:uncharacterized RDD family membrane protein YckC
LLINIPTFNIKGGASSQPNRRYAGFWIRLLAGFIDLMIVSLIIGLAFFQLKHLFPSFAYLLTPTHVHLMGYEMQWYYTMPIVGKILQVVITLLYYSLLESSKWQASIGMKICGLKITDINFQRLRWWQALVRELAAYLSLFLLCIGYVMIAFTQKKQGLHDLIAHTYVIRE